MQFLVTRPQEDAQALAETLRSMGHDALVSPVIEIICQQVTPPHPDKISGLVITSRNALVCLSKQDHIAPYLSLPLFAVGAATAKFAAELGFTTIFEGEGRAVDLVELIRDKRDDLEHPLLYHPGARQHAFDLVAAVREHGIRLISQTLYEGIPAKELTDEARDALAERQLDGVFLMSPRSARLFAELVQQNGLQENAADITCLCLSSAVANALPEFMTAERQIAEKPNLPALLALISSL
jgi:uroporphyrinogen-III synthase